MLALGKLPAPRGVPRPLPPWARARSGGGEWWRGGVRRRGGGIGPACAWPDTPALLAHSGGRFHWTGDESRLTYAWAKWDDGDWAFHGHDYRRRNIALRPIAEYLGWEKHSLGEQSTWRTHHGKVRAEGPSGPPRHAECWHARQVQVVGGRKQRALADACMRPT